MRIVSPIKLFFTIFSPSTEPVIFNISNLILHMQKVALRLDTVDGSN